MSVDEKLYSATVTAKVLTQRKNRLTLIRVQLFCQERQKATELPVNFWPNGHLLLSLLEKKPHSKDLSEQGLLRWPSLSIISLTSSGLCRDPTPLCCILGPQ